MNDALQMLINISASFDLILDFIQAIAVFMGVLMIATAWYDIYVFSLPNPPPRKYVVTSTNIVLRFVAGGIFLTSVAAVQVTGNTLLAQSVSSQSFLYQAAGLSDQQKQSIKAIFGLFAIAGYIAFLKGWRTIVNESKSQQSASAPGGGYHGGVWMIVGGVGLIYLDLILDAISEWTGFDLIKVILF